MRQCVGVFPWVGLRILNKRFCPTSPTCGWSASSVPETRAVQIPAGFPQNGIRVDGVRCERHTARTRFPEGRGGPSRSVIAHRSLRAAQVDFYQQLFGNTDRNQGKIHKSCATAEHLAPAYS
jgi:hypothetical protein